MMKVGLISCASKKLTQAAPAKDLYITDLFMKAQRYANANYDVYHILSALHGLVDPIKITEPYDVTLNDMTPTERKAWATNAAEAIKQRYPAETEFYIHAGRHYRDHLIPLLEAAGHTVHVPLEGMGIGQQLSFYKKAEC